MAKPYNGNKKNHYCVVTFFPKRLTDTTLFLFEGGRFFTEEDMEDYIIWFMTHQGLFIDEIEYRVPYSRCKEVLANDKFVDWNVCSRTVFKRLKESWEKEVLNN